LIKPQSPLLPLYLYTTLGCHLCDDAAAVVVPLLRELAVELIPVEIADDDAMVEFYGERIPVIRLEGATIELAWPFDTALARQYIEAMTG
jgi:hypothetical protein